MKRFRAAEAPKIAAGGSPGSDRALLVAVTVLAAGVILSFWRLHADNNDAALYTLLARRLVQERTPFLLHFPAEDFQHPVTFYEHPPLYLWTQAALLAIAPSFDLRLLGAVCGVLTVAIAFALGREIVGARASFLGCTMLVATDAFSNYQPLARLDPPLTLAFTASVTVLVIARGRLGMLFLGGLIAGMGALIKGPPVLGAPVAAALLIAAQGRGAILREPRSWLVAALGTALPPLTFLTFDHFSLGGAWWNHYVLGQVLGSALGRRGGYVGPFALLHTNVGRFWPGLPFVGVALVRAAVARWSPPERARALPERAALLGWATLVFGGFASSGRSFWWYLMPAYVPLALLAGAGAEDLIPRARVDRFVKHARWLVLGVGATLIVLLPLKVLGRLERPCLFGRLPEQARMLAEGRGQAIAVVLPGRDYSNHVIFAEHCRCDTVLVSRLEDSDRPDVVGALVSSTQAVPERWRRVAVQGRWALLKHMP